MGRRSVAVEYCWEGVDLSKRGTEAGGFAALLSRGRSARETSLHDRSSSLLPHRTSLVHIRIGLVARICRSQSSQDDQFRQGRGSIPRFGIILLHFGRSSAAMRPFFWAFQAADWSAAVGYSANHIWKRRK